MLRGDLNTPNPPLPYAPAALSLGVGWLSNIEARTRALAAQIKLNPAYKQQMGVDKGIVPSAGAVALSVRAIARPLSRVDIRVKRGGYAAVALYSRRGTVWEEIAVLNAQCYEDQRAPLVAWQPEQRIQGYQGNACVGDVSEVIAVVTQP